jgi:hypothetical protein
MSQSDRRRAPRRLPRPAEAVSKVRLRTGRELQVVNIGPAGVLVEAAARLLPGTWVDVHVITTDGRELVRSRVVRAWVCHVSADAILYRGALAFDRLLAVAITAPGPSMPNKTGG